MVMETYSLRLDSERRRKLERIAEEQDRDLSYIIRKAIDEYLKRHASKGGNDR